MKKVDLKITLLLSFVCFVAGLLVVPYQIQSMKTTLPEQYELMMETLPLPYMALVMISALQLLMISFILSFIGIKLARKAGFSLPILDALFSKQKIEWNKNGLLLAVLFGIIVGFVISGSDRFYFQYHIEAIGESTPEFSWLALFAGVFYGGMFEEILMRLLFMSLLVWLFMKLVRNVSSGFYWVAIIIAAALFAAGHLPATEMLFGELTTIVIVRAFVLNGVGGILFGYLYWKKGFEYAVISHMFTHISMNLLFYPLFY